VSECGQGPPGPHALRADADILSRRSLSAQPPTWHQAVDCVTLAQRSSPIGDPQEAPSMRSTVDLSISPV
jgi:hypothetical protein